MTTPCRVGDIEIGPGRALAIIAGPCLLESEALGLEIGERVAGACAELGLPYIFKASFDKANRTSAGSDRGPGLEAGLDAIARIGEKLGVPTTTDIHAPEQAEAAAARVDLLQIPAFLCRQTDLLVAAAEAASKHGRAVNVKKGQFLSPAEMAGPMGKLKAAGCANVMATERGTFFGYNRLVNDFAGLADMMDLGLPVCFDATHSTQLPGAGATSGGRPERAPLLARAAVAAGVHAVFLECHPTPARGKSDAATMLALETVPALLADLARLREAMTPQPAR
jgi:2-dehydro-3-deoxyphosphooctonate aldolase (KDO 8-P synthase)